MRRILFTKSAGWRYEEEWSVWFRLEERDLAGSNHYFYDCDEDIRLREIIIGPLSTITGTELTNAIRRYSYPPRLPGSWPLELWKVQRPALKKCRSHAHSNLRLPIALVE